MTISKSFENVNVLRNVTAPPYTPQGDIAATTVQGAITELDTEKAPLSHTQTASTITDFAEAVDDRVAALLVAGSGATLTYNDAANTLTIAVSPGVGAGEVNTASNVGTGQGLFTTKSGVDLPFKSLTAGNKIALTSNDTEVNIAVTDLSGTNTGDQIASTVPYTPYGNIASTNVQNAINEIDDEKAIKNQQMYIGTTLLTIDRTANPQSLTGIISIDGSASKFTDARTIDGISFDGSANITVVAPATHASSSKTTPVDNDEVPVADSTSSFSLKKLTWANIKATLKTYFDSIYQPFITPGAAGNVLTSNGSEWYSAASAGAADIAGDTHIAGSKGTPVDADEIPLIDSAASFVLRKLTWANLKTTLITTWKDTTDNFVGLTLFKINFKNAANTFTSFLTNTNTASRTYTFPDKDGTIATISDLTAANIVNTPAGNIAAVTVQNALNELDSEKALLAGSASQSFSMTTAAQGTNTTQGASTAFVMNEINRHKNLIINGAMLIDQRNEGAAITAATFTSQFAPDRFRTTCNTSSASSSVQRVADAPVGFYYSYKYTCGTGATPAVGDINLMTQGIIGLNVARLNWGTANAQAVSLQFWVKSSLTGTFAVTLKNAARSYIGQYTIAAANTWQQVKIENIPGDTSGTWATDNTAAIFLAFDLGSGSNNNGASAGTWLATSSYRIVGNTRVINTTGATLQITGVQLEPGAACTSFEHKLENQYRLDCYPYYYKVKYTAASDFLTQTGFAASTTTAYGINKFPVSMRAAPTALEQSGTATDYITVRYGAATTTTCSAVPTFSFATVEEALTLFTVASGLTNGYAGAVFAATPNAYLAWSAEL